MSCLCTEIIPLREFFKKPCFFFQINRQKAFRIPFYPTLPGLWRQVGSAITFSTSILYTFWKWFCTCQVLTILIFVTRVWGVPHDSKLQFYFPSEKDFTLVKLRKNPDHWHGGGEEGWVAWIFTKDIDFHKTPLMDFHETFLRDFCQHL